jgi:hypothetical protein
MRPTKKDIDTIQSQLSDTHKSYLESKEDSEFWLQVAWSLALEVAGGKDLSRGLNYAATEVLAKAMKQQLQVKANEE